MGNLMLGRVQDVTTKVQEMALKIAMSSACRGSDTMSAQQAYKPKNTQCVVQHASPLLKIQTEWILN